MKEDVFALLENKVAKIEKEHGSLENFAIMSTMLEQKHMLKMRESYASFNFQELRGVYQDLHDLDLVDLLDFKEFVDKNYGEYS